MIGRLTTALGRVRNDLAGLLDEKALRDLCRGEGLRWRERAPRPGHHHPPVPHPDPPPQHRLRPHASRIAGRSFTASAYCQARARLPLASLPGPPAATRRGPPGPTTAARRAAAHRTWLVDGTGVSMPDSPALQEAFGQPAAQRPGCGFPTAKVLALFDSATGMLRALHTAPLGAHDLSQVPLIHPEMRPGDILIGDRAYGSFARLAVLAGRGLHGPFRMHQKRVVDFTPGRATPPRWQRKKLSGRPRSRWVRSLGPDDQVVEWYRPLSPRRVALGGGPRGPAAVAAGARAEVQDRSPRLPGEGGHPGDDPAGPGGVSGRGAGQDVPREVANWGESSPSEDDPWGWMYCIAGRPRVCSKS